MIVGVDYSTKAVDLAVIYGDGSAHHLKLVVNGLDAPFLDAMSKALRLHATWGNDEPVIYIEQPWSRYNQATAMLMVKVATAVQVVAIQNGYRVEWAHVASWRSAVFGKGKYSKEVAKRLSREWATAHTGLEIGKDDNAADACCIAQFGELKERDG